MGQSPGGRSLRTEFPRPSPKERTHEDSSPFDVVGRRHLDDRRLRIRCGRRRLPRLGWRDEHRRKLSPNAAFTKTIHTPVLIVLGGPSDIAYENGERDYTNISTLGVPIMLFSKDIGHGGDLFGARGGDFAKIDLAWLNWQLKGDETATGKGLLVGSGCTYCTNAAWEVKSMNLK